jgi:hypothetical protein
MTIRDAIDILGLKKPVSHEAVKKAFRDKAKLYHPDKQKDEESRKLASETFILARKASEILLSVSAAVINDPASHRRPDPIIRRTQRAPVQAAPVFDSPLIKEFDNVIRLFRLLIGNKKEVKKSTFNFQPGAWLGIMFEFLIERRFLDEDKLHGLGFALYRLLRLSVGAIFLIAGFLALSIFGMLFSAVIFPPFLVFYGLYHLYTQLLDFQASKMNREVKINNKATWLSMRKTYLQLRTFPVFGMIMLAMGLIRLSQLGTFYLQSLGLVFLTLVFMLLLSVIYEWVYFYKVSSKWE